jgi:hypothetical protein
MKLGEWSQVYDWLIKIGAGALVGGLVVNEIKRRIEMAGENRKYLGRALSDLLEIRYYLATTRVMKKEIERLLGNDIPPGQAGLLVHLIAPQLLQFDWAALRTRYNDAVTALAGIHPILAYKLRSKDSIGTLLQQLGALAAGNISNPVEAAQRAQFLSWLDQVVEKQAYGLPDLAEAASLVARKHGWRTSRATKQALKRQDSIDTSPEIQDAMKTLKSQLDSAAATAVATGAGIPSAPVTATSKSST